MKVLSGIASGIILGIVLLAVFGLVLAPVLMSSVEGAMFTVLLPWIVGIGVGVLVAVTAPTAGKVWRRMLIVSGLLCYSLPLAAFVFTGHIAAQAPAGAGAGAAAGAIVSGAIIGGFLGFVGFFSGSILLIIGLLVGRGPKVVYVQAPPPGGS